ncbi:hypothetical protein KRMM14A1004_61780 [Krasilnikovia sp. MM14-A1004]
MAYVPIAKTVTGLPEMAARQGPSAITPKDNRCGSAARLSMASALVTTTGMITGWTWREPGPPPDVARVPVLITMSLRRRIMSTSGPSPYVTLISGVSGVHRLCGTADQAGPR